MSSWVAAAGATFKSVDWFVPPYFQGGAVRRIAAAIDAASAADRHAVLERELPSLYRPTYLAVMLLERYPQVSPVNEFLPQIREAMEAACLGLRHAAVATMLTVIEGTIRKYATANGRDVGPGTKRLVLELAEMAQTERVAAGSEPDAFLERAEMLDQLHDFLSERLLKSTSVYAGINALNRHGILHGIFDGYGASGNFEKLVSFLDGLVFYFSLKTAGVSCLAPDVTDRSTRMALYFRALRVAQQVRPQDAP